MYEAVISKDSSSFCMSCSQHISVPWWPWVHLPGRVWLWLSTGSCTVWGTCSTPERRCILRDDYRMKRINILQSTFINRNWHLNSMHTILATYFSTGFKLKTKQKGCFYWIGLKTQQTLLTSWVPGAHPFTRDDTHYDDNGGCCDVLDSVLFRARSLVPSYWGQRALVNCLAGRVVLPKDTPLPKAKRIHWPVT